MEPIDDVTKGLLRKAIPELKQLTNCNDMLLDLLVSYDAYTPIDKQEIKCNATEDSRNSEFYSKLMMKSMEDCTKTVQGLRSCGQNMAAQILENALKGHAVANSPQGGYSADCGARAKDNIWFEIGFLIESFTGRTTEVERLHESVSKLASNPTVINQTASVAGLGGIGKSTLARKYAYMYKAYYGENAIWINAESQATFKSSISRLFKKHFSSHDANGKTDANLVRIIYGHFSSKRQKCLIIFDNVEEFDVLKLLPKDLDSPNPVIPNVLITSRRTEWRTGVSVLNLDVLSVGDSITFLKTYTHTSLDQVVEHEDLEKLANSLQCLPLALQQASAFIRAELGENPNPIKKYLELMDSEKLSVVLDYINEDLSEHEKTTLYTWTITLENIEKRENGPLAIKIMNMISLFEPDNIPVHMLGGSKLASKSISESNNDSGNRDSSEPLKLFDDIEFREDAVNKAIQMLKTYSMISGPVGMINIHRLVQRVIQLNVRKEITTVLANALKLLTDWMRLCQNLKPGITHAESIWRYALLHDELIQEYAEFPSLLCQNNSLKVKLILDSRARIEHIFGSKHKNTILIKYFEAKEIGGVFMWTILKSLEILDDIEPLARSYEMHELVEWIYELYPINFRKIRKYERELEALVILETLKAKKYGIEHKSTLKTLLHKARALTDLGRIDERRQLLQNVNEVRERLDYVTDKYLVHAMSELALSLANKEELQEATRWSQTAYEVHKNVYGVENPWTLNKMIKLAQCLVKQGELDKAVELCRALIEVKKKYGGDNHSAMLEMAYLAEYLTKSGKFDEALDVYLAIAPVQSEGKGGANSDLYANAMRSVAMCLMKKGRLDEVIMDLFRTFVDQLKIVKGGEEGQTLLRALAALAKVLMKKGEFAEAVELLRTAAETWKRVEGDESRETLSASVNLAFTLAKKGDMEEAVEMLRNVVKIRKAVCGEEDESTLDSIADLAKILIKKGELDEAFVLCVFVGEASLKFNYKFEKYTTRPGPLFRQCQTKIRWLKLRNCVLSLAFRNLNL